MSINLHPELAVLATLQDRFGTVHFTPAMAKAALESSPGNACRSKQKIRTMRLQMQNGQFPFTGESIIFDEEFRLMDGHHRLTALMQAGVTLPFLVVVGVVRAEAWGHIDVGTTRGNAFWLAMKGEERSALLAPTLSALLKFERTQRIDGVSTSYTAEDVSDCLSRHPGVREHAHRYSWRTQLKIETAAMRLLGYLFAEADADMAEVFFVKLGQCGNRTNGPVLEMLKSRLIADISERAKKGADTPASMLIYQLVVQSWNLWLVHGDSELSHKQLQTNTSAFPKIARLDYTKFQGKGGGR